MKTVAEHLTYCTVEECGEVLQVIGKIGRFGINDYHPKTNNLTNKRLLLMELHDLIAVSEMLAKELKMQNIWDEDRIVAKKEKVLKYMKYSREVGQLEKETPSPIKERE